MSTILLVIKSELTQADAQARFQLDTARPKIALLTLLAYLRSCVGGVYACSLDMHTGSASPVAATATIALTQANIDDGDTVTIGGQTLTAKASGANGTTQFNKGGTVTISGDNLAALINAHATLSKFMTALNASGTLTLTMKEKGAIGNLIVMSTSDATAYGLTAFASGAGGADDTPVNYAFGL